MTQPDDLSHVDANLCRVAAKRLRLGVSGPETAAALDALADRIESPTPAEDHGADALAWMRAQAKALGMTNADTEVPLYLARCLASHITFPTPAEARGGDALPPLGIDTANHAGVRVRGYTVEQYATLARQLAEAKAECSLLTHKVITCGVAARHPDPNLSRTGAYAGEWNSNQAEDVRALRTRAEQAEAQLAQATARLAAVEGLAGKWRDDANIDASLGADHMAEATRNCARELDAALQPKEPQHND